MELTSTFACANDHVFNDRQWVEGIDHLIMTVTEVARWLSQDSEPVDGEIISPEWIGADEMSSVRSAGV